MLISSILSSKLLLLVGAACLFWIGLLSLAFMALSGLAVSSGWIVGGALICATLAWLLVMFREIREAVEISDPFESESHFSRDITHLKRTEIFSEDSGPYETWALTQTQVRRRPRRARSCLTGATAKSSASDFFHPDV